MAVLNVTLKRHCGGWRLGVRAAALCKSMSPQPAAASRVQFNLLQVFAQPLNGSNDVTIKYCSFQPKDSPKNYNGDSGKAAYQINRTYM